MTTDSPPDRVSLVIRRPGAWLPIALALATLAYVVAYAAMFGVDRPTGDEGAPARLFQLALAIQTVLIAAFALRWLPRSPRAATVILALQVAALAAQVMAVIVLESIAA